MSNTLPSRKKSLELLKKYIKNEGLINHCQMVGQAMEAYAKKFGENEEMWYQTGLLHDLDWEMFPDEHPLKAVKEILPENNYPAELIEAVAAYAHGFANQTRVPETKMEKYLYACDELCGLLHAYSLMRPNGFSDMKVKSVKKKIKDKAFASGVDREAIKKGYEMIEESPEEHIQFLIEVFKKVKNI